MYISPHFKCYCFHWIISVFTFQKTTPHTRLGIIHNPTGDKDNTFVKAIQVALDSLDRHTAKLFITKLLNPLNANQIVSNTKSVIDFAVSVSIILILRTLK